MQRLPYLYYKGTNSLEFCLYIKSKATYDAPERDKTYISVPGRNGDLIQDNGRYKNVAMPYTLAVVKSDNRPFNELTDSIKEWLSIDSGYYELWDSYDPRFFRYASVSGALNIAEDITNYGEFTVNFNCKPYRYLFDGQKTIAAPKAGLQLINPFKIAAEPYIKIYGNGNISMSVNNTTVSFTGVSGYIEIDSEIKNAYKGLTLLNNIMTGDTFPTLEPGVNEVTFTGSVTKAEIVPRWCTI